MDQQRCPSPVSIPPSENSKEFSNPPSTAILSPAAGNLGAKANERLPPAVEAVPDAALDACMDDFKKSLRLILADWRTSSAEVLDEYFNRMEKKAAHKAASTKENDDVRAAKAALDMEFYSLFAAKEYDEEPRLHQEQQQPSHEPQQLSSSLLPELGILAGSGPRIGPFPSSPNYAKPVSSSYSPIVSPVINKDSKLIIDDFLSTSALPLHAATSPGRMLLALSRHRDEARKHKIHRPGGILLCALRLSI
jgi:hypothetical protein